MIGANDNPILIDVTILLVAILSVVSLAFLPLHPDSTVSIPTIINGLTTATSIMVGFSGLSQLRGFHRQEETPTSHSRIRAYVYGAILMVILQFIGIIYLQLLSGEGIIAFKMALSVFQISFLVAMANFFHSFRS